MKNKKSLLSLGLLALVLVLGVGYAVVSSVDLKINGTAKGVESATLKVEFTKVEDTVNADLVKSHSLTAPGTSDTFEISGMELNKTVTMVYTVANNETDINADLSVELTNNNSEYFEVTYVVAESALNAGKTTTVTVNVKMVKTPVVSEKNTATIGLTITATPVNNANAS